MKKSLVYFLLLFLPLSVTAYQVEIVAPVSECVEGESVFLEIHVFPATPAHTTVEVESIPRGFSLVSSRKERRRRDDPSSFNSGRVNSVVFFQEWTAGQAGFKVLGPFIVEVDGVEQVLAPLEVQVHVRHDGGRGELRWKIDGELRNIHRGKAVALVLEGRYLHETFALHCPPPRNALLEQSDVDYEPEGLSGGEWKPVAHFSWTPLSTGTQALPFARIVYRSEDGEEISVGTTRRTVLVRSAGSAGQKDPESPLLSDAFTVSSQQTDEEDSSMREVPVPESFNASTDPGLALARKAWQDGNHGEAIATLRRIEYTAMFPGQYRRIRQDAERALGFAEYPPPPSRMLVRIIPALFGVFLLMFVLLFPLRKKARILSVCFVLAGSLLLIIAAAGLFVLPPALHPEAVSTGGALRQIPEDNAGTVSTISAGTPVTVLKKTGTWYYVRLPTSGRGWVPDDQIIPYTSAGLYGFW